MNILPVMPVTRGSLCATGFNDNQPTANYLLIM